MIHKDEFEYAGFWVRVAASIIDSILIFIITLPILLMIYGEDYWHYDTVFAGLVDFIVSVVLPSVAIIFFWIRLQATPGKMAIRAKIVDAYDGEKPSKGQYVGRFFAYIPAFLFLGIGIIWVAFDPRKQGWHDKLAGTVVISSKNKVRFENHEDCFKKF